MLFNSLDFALFFPLVTLGYFLLPHRHRWWWLLLASSGFYMFFKAVYVLILFFTIVVDYIAGILIEKAPEPRRRLYLVTSIVANIGVLAVFKYYNFLNSSVSGLFTFFGGENPVPALRILLPIGLSFHTFQAMSYTIEVYRGRQKAERHFGLYALYVMFYPQLVAGPIERPQNMLHQFRERHRFDAGRAAEGVKLMAWGLFMKVVVGDRVAIFVDAAFGNPDVLHGEAMWLLMYMGAFNLYADFAGYSLVALGSAQVMGFRLMNNFRRPFLATTLAEHWRRWHVSLTTWFRDYLYIPLRRGRLQLGHRSALFIVFMATGLWHGGAWSYIVWGAYMGAYLVLADITLPWRNRAWEAIQRRFEPQSEVHTAGPTFGVRQVRHLVGVFCTYTAWCSGCLTFFVRDIRDTPVMVGNLLEFGNGFGELFKLPGVEPFEFWIALAMIGLVVLVDLVEERERFTTVVARWRAPARWALYAALALAFLMFGEFGEREFVYFQF